jgi:hypothetical protein
MQREAMHLWGMRYVYAFEDLKVCVWVWLFVRVAVWFDESRFDLMSCGLIWWVAVCFDELQFAARCVLRLMLSDRWSVVERPPLFVFFASANSLLQVLTR